MDSFHIGDIISTIFIFITLVGMIVIVIRLLMMIFSKKQTTLNTKQLTTCSTSTRVDNAYQSFRETS